MGLLDRLRNETVDIIEWLDHTRDTLVWRFPRYRNEIKQGAQLIVRPGQVAVMVHRGRLADLFEPGTHRLITGNLPVLSSLLGWRHGFESPFKTEVYFVNTRQITDLTWGTPNPIPMRDSELGVVRVRAFGSYALRALDPRALLTELVGTDQTFEADEIHELMRSLINSCLAEVLTDAGLPALEMANAYPVLSDRLRLAVSERVDRAWGLDVPSLFITNISFPEEVEKALDARSSISALGDLGHYQRYQLGQSMPIAAQSGGGSGDVLGIGMGLAMASGLTGNTQQPAALPPGAATPPLLPPAPAFHLAIDGQSRGPYPLQQVAEALASGELTTETLVWAPGMERWARAREVPMLAAGIGPPPLPPESPPLDPEGGD